MSAQITISTWLFILQYYANSIAHWQAEGKDEKTG